MIKEGLSTDPFHTECKAYECMLECLQPLENVPRFLDVGDRYIELEYIEGMTLDVAVPDLEVSDIKGISEQLRQTLQDLHKLGIVHGDIRALNILVRREFSPPRAVLIDFSRARFQSDSEDWENDKKNDFDDLDNCIDYALENMKPPLALNEHPVIHALSRLHNIPTNPAISEGIPHRPWYFS